MNEIWTIVHKERDALIRDLETLNPEEWTTPSLCPGWDVHDVLAHLVDDAKTTPLGFVGRMVTAGFNFDRTNALGIARERSADPAHTLATFRKVRNRTTSAPAPSITRWVEIFVHGEDIRRPLGMEHQYPVAEVATALRYQAKTSVKVGGGRERLMGLRLIATDAAFDEGHGKEVRGTATALLLAASGRPVNAGEMTGPGALSLTGTT
ncbi:MAG: maleylpyruvate isomerase family mycothiol-dependent enzyme [Candidatus Saccharibacteria bacterium]|nr:maleylpyruvate isomerase family mycothiol-dependent enzyme [Microbacteriaceae bacterium]